MALDINLPEMGDDIKEGTIVSLAFKPGDPIRAGETLAEVETDKAVLGVPANNAGVLLEWYVKEGDTLKVGDRLCKIDEDGASGESKSAKVSKNSKARENSANTSAVKPEKPEPKTTPAPSHPASENNSNSTKQAVKFTDLGDGIASGTVVSIAVKVGDTLKAGDTLLELETDKAVVEFPSPASGIVSAIHVQEGQEIKVGDKGFDIDIDGESSVSTTAPEVSQPQSAQNAQNPQSTPAEPSITVNAENKTLVPVSPSSQSISMDLSNVLAGPATRKLARELGVDISKIKDGSGRGNRIMVEDVKKHVKKILSDGSVAGSSSNLVDDKPLPDFSQWGSVKHEKTSKLRDTIANAITYAWQTIPHVHQYDNIYIDKISALQKKWKDDFVSKGSTLSVTPFIIKALAQCLKDFPQFNSSYNSANKEVILKEYYNVGVAVDTPQGLIVPVIKDVNTLSIFDIGVALKTLAKQTRERTVKPEDLRGGCISLSNLGGIGGTHFNPIINWPEVAILGVGRGGYTPVYNQEKKEFDPHMLLPACLAYDHRVIDGADGARFMVQLKHYLENPDLLLMGVK